VANIAASGASHRTLRDPRTMFAPPIACEQARKAAASRRDPRTMFAPPPICRRSRRNDAPRTELAAAKPSFRWIRRRRRLSGEHRCERSEPSNAASSSGEAIKSDPALLSWTSLGAGSVGKQAAVSRLAACEQTRKAAASRRDPRTMFAPPICRRSRRNDAPRTEPAAAKPSFRWIRRRRRLSGEHRCERSEPSNAASSSSEAIKHEEVPPSAWHDHHPAQCV
jgi:hypothetical protein